MYEVLLCQNNLTLFYLLLWLFISISFTNLWYLGGSPQSLKVRCFGRDTLTYFKAVQSIDSASIKQGY